MGLPTEGSLEKNIIARCSGLLQGTLVNLTNFLTLTVGEMSQCALKAELWAVADGKTSQCGGDGTLGFGDKQSGK